MSFRMNKHGFSVECPDRETVNQYVEALFRTFADGDVMAFDSTMSQLQELFDGSRYDITTNTAASYPWVGYLEALRAMRKRQQEEARAEAERLVPFPPEPGSEDLPG